MNDPKKDPGQSKEQNPNNENPSQATRQTTPVLQPVEDVLRRLNYPPLIIENYSRLIPKSLHLAELYRLGAIDAPGSIAEKKKRINPIQARMDRKGRVWIDVLLERQERVTLKELRQIMRVHSHTGRFVAGRVLADRLPDLIDKSLRLEASRPIASTLYKSVPNIQADQATLSQQFPAVPGQEQIDGRNIIIGIIDNGCDFKHPNFYNSIIENGVEVKKTRILFIWDQNGTGGPKPQSFKYGTEYTQDRIDQALKSGNPYDALGYAPQENLNKVLHGTHVMGIAAGNSTEFPGVAPAADLIFVDLGKPTNKAGKIVTPEDEELKTLGSSWNLFNAVKYIFDKADQLKKPAVINISQGTNGGSHDGTSIVETMLDQVLRKTGTYGRAIVIAAGNSHGDDIHTSGEIGANQSRTIRWVIGKEAPIDWELRQELEIWYNKDTALRVKLVDPDGSPRGEIPLGETAAIGAEGSLRMPIEVLHLGPDAEQGEDENHIDILIDNRNESPVNLNHIWRVELSLNPENDAAADYHAWIERNLEAYQSHFAADSQENFTLNSIGNGELPIVVGSYNSGKNTFPIDSKSGQGPTRNKKDPVKPELSAPGVNIYSAEAGTDGDGTRKSGTSSAAPHVSGVIALMFQAARDRRNPSKVLGIQEIRSILIETADHDPPAIGAAHPQYGFGRVNALKAIKRTLL